MRTWRFVKSLATFNVFREGLVASELLENSVDPPLKFLRSFDQGFVDKLLTFSVVAPWVGCEKHQGGPRKNLEG